MDTRTTGFKRSMMLQVVTSCLLVALMLAAGESIGHSASSVWKPEKNVELIVGTTPGGGSDLMARMIQTVWQTKGMVKPSVTVVNKPGGGLTIAMSYLHQQAGDGHYLMFASPSFLTNHIVGTSPLKYTDFTPLAILGVEPIIFSVKADSKIKTGKDLIERLKKDPKSISIGISAARGNHNHMAVGLVMKEAGGEAKNLKVVIFDSSAKGMMALMGGHVDLISSPVDSVLQHVQTGNIRMIASASERRLSGEVSSVPTWKEQGINAVVDNMRVVMAPKGLSQAQIAYWDDVFAKTVSLAEWVKFEKDGFSEPFYKYGKECYKYLENQYATYKDVLTYLGLAK